MTVRTRFAADVRAALVTLLEDFRDDFGVSFSIYRARPRSIQPTHAFVEGLSEVLTYPGVTQRNRTMRAEVLVVFGVFDQGDTVDARDAFVDAFLDWTTDRVHAAGADTTFGILTVEDEPTWVPDWVAPEAQKTYYATRFVGEAFIGNT